MVFDESGSVIHRNIYVQNITGLNVVHRTPVDVGCGWLKVVFAERCCLPCWVALWSLALGDPLPRLPRLIDWHANSACLETVPNNWRTYSGEQMFLRLRLAEGGEKYPRYGGRSNSSWWVSWYMKNNENYNPQPVTDMGVRSNYQKNQRWRSSYQDFVMCLCEVQRINSTHIVGCTHFIFPSHYVLGLNQGHPS